MSLPAVIRAVAADVRCLVAADGSVSTETYARSKQLKGGYGLRGHRHDRSAARLVVPRLRSATVRSRASGQPKRRAMAGRYLESMTARTAEERRADLKRRRRPAFVEGAEEDSRRRLGRGLTRDELKRVLRRYPGDV